MRAQRRGGSGRDRERAARRGADRPRRGQRLGYSPRRAHLDSGRSSPQSESIDDIGALERAAAEFAVKLGGRAGCLSHSARS